MLGGATIVTLSMLLLSGETGGQNFRELKEQIEKQRQIESIKSTIISHVRTNRLLDPNRQLGGPNSYGRMEETRDNPFPPSMPDPWPSTPLPTKPPADKKPKSPMIVLGDPANSERDGCLKFTIARHLNITSKIKPVKMDLYVHITKESRKKARRNSRHANKRSRQRREKSPKRKNKSKKKRKGKGKRIKLSVSNGNKRLAKLRMRVTKTHWYNIELPISQFPKEISPTDNFKLCIACKRCKKKIRLDLYRDQTDNKTVPLVPFIHIKTDSDLPQSRLRSKRSTDMFKNGGRPLQNRDNGAPSLAPTCCKEEIFSEDVDIPYLLQPTKFNISFCETLQSNLGSSVLSTNTLNYLLSMDSSGVIQRKCVSSAYGSFTYSFIDTDLRIKYASIPNLLPLGCKCVKS